MTLRKAFTVVVPIVLAGIALSILPVCGGGLNLDMAGEGSASGSGSGAGLGDIASAAANCPNLASVSAIGKVNFAKEFGLDARAAAKLESALVASAELKGISTNIKADLKGACGKLARDLGANPGNSAESACKAAANAIKQFKIKAGGKFTLDVVPPKCSASMDAMAKCSADCDVNVQKGKVDVQCEGGKLSGKCEAECNGTCDVDVAASCNGTCRGSCSAQFSGDCAGECNGKCDGKSTNGSATCDGKCEGIFIFL